MDWKDLLDDISNVVKEAGEKIDAKAKDNNIDLSRLKEVNINKVKEVNLGKLKDVDLNKIKEASLGKLKEVDYEKLKTIGLSKLEQVNLSGIAETVSNLGQRMTFGYQEITREEHLRVLKPLLKEVEEAARRVDSTIPEGVRVYVKYTDTQNIEKKVNLSNKKPVDIIRALNENTLGITDTFFTLPANAQKAVLGIGFGKLVYFLNGKVFKNESLSDEFCFNIGYGNELCEYLDTLLGPRKEIDARIGNLQKMGCNYKMKSMDENDNSSDSEDEENNEQTPVFINVTNAAEDSYDDTADNKEEPVTAIVNESLKTQDAKKICASCNEVIPAGAKFCPYCGNRNE